MTARLCNADVNGGGGVTEEGVMRASGLQRCGVRVLPICLMAHILMTSCPKQTSVWDERWKSAAISDMIRASSNLCLFSADCMIMISYYASDFALQKLQRHVVLQTHDRTPCRSQCVSPDQRVTASSILRTY